MSMCVASSEPNLSNEVLAFPPFNLIDDIVFLARQKSAR